MRTTIRLDEALLRETKERAARTGQTMTAVIEHALRASFASSSVARHRATTVLPTVGGTGLQPGVDLDDSAALLDLMEGGRS
jgi:hypothetical protein